MPAPLAWVVGLVVLVTLVIAVGAIELATGGRAPFGATGLESLPGWVWGAVVGSVTSGVFLARTHVLKSQHRRSLEALQLHAELLDELSPSGREPQPVSGVAAEVLAAMNLSALRLRGQLAQERAFGGQAAHQLRTPLTALGLALEELTMHPETPRRLRADLHRCRQEVDRLADIVADLLALARRGALPAGKFQTDPAVVAIHATRRWESSARAVGREVRVAGPLPDCQVSAPTGPPSQVLDVLIDNALKHGAGDIEVSVDAWADRVRLRVVDQGTPERFGAGHSTSAGEGMGLRVAQKLAAACGGRVVRALHPTTAFDLVLPRYAPEPSVVRVPTGRQARD